jgi:hypothetical protein
MSPPGEFQRLVTDKIGCLEIALQRIDGAERSERVGEAPRISDPARELCALLE